MSLPDFSKPSTVDGYYGVFISFSGRDTRRHFTTDLCHSLRRSGIHTFLDAGDMNLKIGSSIDDLHQIIRQSRIAIVVYSENYASSRYSLMELQTIMLQRRDHGMKMMPIFYRVDPAELRPPFTGRTAHLLDKHRATVDHTTLLSWEVALTEIGQLPRLSYQLYDQRAEYAFIDKAVAMIKQQMPFSKQVPPSYEYDVFLSFRGDDTRETFASTLCYVLCVGHNVKTFMDVSLRKGHKLEELLAMVEKSRISIVVYSENFAESEWCLKELEKIFKESNRRGHEVVPVFYKVDPSELRHLDTTSGKTNEHMNKHHNKYGKDSDDIKSWSKAIEELGHISGYPYWSNRDKLEVELATEIAQEIWTRLPGKDGEKRPPITSSYKLKDIISMVGYQSTTRNSSICDCQFLKGIFKIPQKIRLVRDMLLPNSPARKNVIL